LASGSGGNSIYAESGGEALLIDAGVSRRQIEVRLSAIGASMENVRAVLVTHEHDDHVKGLPVLMKKHPVPAYMTEGTMRALPAMPAGNGIGSRLKTFRATQPFEIGPWAIQAFATPHDAKAPVGFVLEAEGFRLGIATDMGKVTSQITSRLCGLDALILEFNHDPQMLACGFYPEYVKSRIASPSGHLANEEAGSLLQEIAHARLRSVTLAHLSENNNEPELARSVAKQSLAEYDVPIGVARQREPLWVGDFRASGAAGSATDEQMSFPLG
jgi:phosphoribosyl 1,2-cyclic phosphodiesterase